MTLKQRTIPRSNLTSRHFASSTKTHGGFDNAA